MRVLYISPNSPYESIGGVERHISNLISYYQAKKDTHICIMIPCDDEPHVHKAGRVTIYFDPSLSLTKKITLLQREVTEKSRTFQKNVAKILVDEHIELVCAENFHIGLPPAYSLQLNMICQLHQIPTILRLHSFASTELQAELVKQLPWNNITCVSKSVTGDCFKKGTPIEMLSTNYLGVDTEIFITNPKARTQLRDYLDLAHDTQIVLSVSRILLGVKPILQQKGLIALIQAFSKLTPVHPQLRLVLAIGRAPGSLQSEFDEAIRRLHGYIQLHNVERQTVVTMFSLDEMPFVYQGSDVFVLASENETFGQVFLEAMSCGVPVVGTNVGGIPEIIRDTKNGYLIPPADSSSIALKIEMLLLHPEIRQQFSIAGRQTIEEKFSLDSQLDEFHRYLENTIV